MRLIRRFAAALKSKRAGVGLVLFLLCFTVLLTAAIDFFYYYGRIYPDVYLHGIPLGQLSIDDAERKLNTELFSLKKITFTGLADGAESIPLERLGLSWDQKKTMASIIRKGTGLTGYPGRLRRLYKRTPLRVKGRLKIKTKIMKRALKDLAIKVEMPPREASFIVKGAQVTIEEEQEGRFLKVDQLQKILLTAIVEGWKEVPLPIESKKSERSAATLSRYGVERVMVSFSTAVSAALPERVQNIELGARAINAHLMAPGELFSFEAIIGAVTREKGYREAPVIVGEELRPGLGGGLCQVSSTLYNAALLANLSILERHNHSFPIGYLPIGRDATISLGSADLKFKNSRDHYILIGAELKEGLLTFRLFGRPMNERVEIESSDITRVEPPVRYEQDNTLPAGKKELIRAGEPGYSVKIWRVVYRGDKEISRELLSHDRYRPITAVYRVGGGRS